MMLSEISQTEKVKCHMMAFTWNFFKKYKKLVTIKKNKPTHRYREETSGDQRGGGRGERDKKAQTISYKISCKDIRYNTGHRANIL